MIRFKRTTSTPTNKHPRSAKRNEAMGYITREEYDKLQSNVERYADNIVHDPQGRLVSYSQAGSKGSTVQTDFYFN